jgi:hypothetical protein
MFDVSLGQNRSRLCNGVSRRSFLRVGALAPFGLSLAGMLSMQQRARAAALPGFAAPRPLSPDFTPKAKSVVLIYLGGGLSHHDTFDMKPDAPENVRGNYKSIPTSVAGLRVGELLPRTAQVMDKVALVRSQSHDNDHHETATNWVLSGRFGSPFGDYPAMGAVVAHETGFEGRLLPPYVAIPKNPSFTWELGKSAYLGGRYESFKAGDPNQKDYKVRDLSAPAPLTPRSAERRRSLLGAVDTLAARV